MFGMLANAWAVDHPIGSYGIEYQVNNQWMKQWSNNANVVQASRSLNENSAMTSMRFGRSVYRSEPGCGTYRVRVGVKNGGANLTVRGVRLGSPFIANNDILYQDYTFVVYQGEVVAFDLTVELFNAYWVPDAFGSLELVAGFTPMNAPTAAVQPSANPYIWAHEVPEDYGPASWLRKAWTPTPSLLFSDYVNGVSISRGPALCSNIGSLRYTKRLVSTERGKFRFTMRVKNGWTWLRVNGAYVKSNNSTGSQPGDVQQQVLDLETMNAGSSLNVAFYVCFYGNSYDAESGLTVTWVPEAPIAAVAPAWWWYYDINDYNPLAWLEKKWTPTATALSSNYHYNSGASLWRDPSTNKDVGFVRWTKQLVAAERGKFRFTMRVNNGWSTLFLGGKYATFSESTGFSSVDTKTIDYDGPILDKGSTLNVCIAMSLKGISYSAGGDLVVTWIPDAPMKAVQPNGWTATSAADYTTEAWHQKVWTPKPEVLSEYDRQRDDAILLRSPNNNNRSVGAARWTRKFVAPERGRYQFTAWVKNGGCWLRCLNAWPIIETSLGFRDADTKTVVWTSKELLERGDTFNVDYFLAFHGDSYYAGGGLEVTWIEDPASVEYNAYVRGYHGTNDILPYDDYNRYLEIINSNDTVPGYYNTYLRSLLAEPLTYIDWFYANFSEIERQCLSEPTGCTFTEIISDIGGGATEGDDSISGSHVGARESNSVFLDPSISLFGLNKHKFYVGFEFKGEESPPYPLPFFPSWCVTFTSKKFSANLLGTYGYTYDPPKHDFDAATATRKWAAGARVGFEGKVNIQPINHYDGRTKIIEWPTFGLGVRYRSYGKLVYRPGVEFVGKGEAALTYEHTHIRHGGMPKSNRIASFDLQPSASASVHVIKNSAQYITEKLINGAWVQSSSYSLVDIKVGVKGEFKLDTCGFGIFSQYNLPVHPDYQSDGTYIFWRIGQLTLAGSLELKVICANNKVFDYQWNPLAKKFTTGKMWAKKWHEAFLPVETPTSNN
jgi:hypothetical protein